MRQAPLSRSAALDGEVKATAHLAAISIPTQPPLDAHLRFHSCESSSKTILLRFCFVMPFFCANSSHLVGARGLGSGFSRGRAVVGAGRCAMRPGSFPIPRRGQGR